MLRGNSRRRVKPKSPNGWLNGKDHPGVIRRRLTDATWSDRALIALFFFITGVLATGFLYWYLSQPDTAPGTYSRRGPHSLVMPLETMTGEEATTHFLWVCLGGGVFAALAYVAISIIDPYGTTASAKAEAKRKRDQLELLKQAGFPVDGHKPLQNSAENENVKS